MDPLIIKILYGGLGDHLFFSHVPRIAKETGGYKKVLISNKSLFRAPDTKKLVWGMNPFVDGFTDEDGETVDGVRIESGEDLNLLDKIMMGFGLDDGKRFHEPEIHYKPRVIEGLKGKDLYDPNYISNAGFINGPGVEAYMKKNGLWIDHQMVLREKKAVPIFRFGSFLRSDTIYDFIDVLNSVRNIYCLVTGTATLAAAIGKKANVFYSGEMSLLFRHSRNNHYVKL